MKTIVINIEKLVGVVTLTGDKKNASAQLEEIVLDALLRVISVNETKSVTVKINNQRRCSCQGMDLVLNFSSDQHLRKLRQQKYLIEQKKSRLKFLETHGLRHESELWIGNKINPELIEKLWIYQNLIRKQTGGQKKSRTEVYKAMQDAIKWFGFSPC